MSFVMSPRELQAVLVLADELHFGRAAQRLGIAQPQLSQMLKRVEQMVGFPIFTRRPAVSATPAGRVLVAACGRAISDLDQSVSTAREIALGRRGSLHVGFSDAAMLTELPSALRRFTREHPQVKLRLTEGHSQLLLEQLERGQLDVVVSRQQATDERLTSTRIIPDSVVLAVAACHRLSGSSSVRLECLREEDFLLFSRTAAPVYHDALLAACRLAGLEPRIAQHVDTRAATLALVAADFGVTLSTAASQRLGYPGVAFCRIEEEMPDVGFWLSYPGSTLSPAGARLVAALEELGERV